MKNSNIRALLQALNWECNDYKLIQQALTHSSYAYEQGEECEHNERLEYLGDAVLELSISDYLFRNYPNFSEGDLTRLRADIVCEASLAKMARKVDLQKHIKLGKGEEASGSRQRTALLADVIESLIGAVYLDQGFAICYQNVIDFFHPLVQDLANGELRHDYKTLVQEMIQAKLGITPVYRVVNESGPAHDKTFTAQVLFADQVQGEGVGRSKKEAEQMAAKNAWENSTALGAEAGADK